MFGVQPVAHERFARCAFALCNFVLVMRKCQVDSASMNIQSLSEILHGHRRTLNVPSGAARPKRSFPEVLSRLWRFPERKVPRALFFVAIVVDARARLNTRQIDLRKLSIRGESRDAVINGTIPRLDECFFLQSLY